MAVQLSTAVRNAELDSIETTVGVSALLKLRTGAQPANCAAADSGTVVSTITLPVDWMNAAAAGAKTKLGVWEDTLADAAGTVAHWRLYESTGVTCHGQGTVTISGGGGDLTLDNNVVAINQDVIVTSWTFTAGNP